MEAKVRYLAQLNPLTDWIGLYSERGSMMGFEFVGSVHVPVYIKFVDEDYLIVEFKCPIEAENFKSWSECHYIF